MKKEFMQWEKSINQQHEKKIKNDKNKEEGTGSSSGQTGAAFPFSSAVHAALGRKCKTPKNTQRCHFGHTSTSSKIWLRNPIPSFWAGVPSEVTLCYRCYQRGYRGGFPPEHEPQDAPT